jgi:hypothetical protein
MEENCKGSFFKQEKNNFLAFAFKIYPMFGRSITERPRDGQNSRASKRALLAGSTYIQVYKRPG